VPGKVFLFDMEIKKVDWAEPEIEFDDSVMAEVKKNPTTNPVDIVI
jgi:hypothetical protein